MCDGRMKNSFENMKILYNEAEDDHNIALGILIDIYKDKWSLHHLSANVRRKMEAYFAHQGGVMIDGKFHSFKKKDK